MTTLKTIKEIEAGDHDDELEKLALAITRRRKRVRILRRKRKESPVVGEFTKLVQANPGLNAEELGALYGVTSTRIYQVATMAEKYVRIDLTQYPRRFWPKDTDTH